MDPKADAVIASLDSEGVLKINELFQKLTKNRGIENVEFSPIVDAYFKEQATKPDWIDHERLLRGQEVYANCAAEVSMLLFFLSLPATYTGWRGATVLTVTGRMMRDPNSPKDQEHFDRLKRRLMETAQFIIDVMGPSAWDEDGTGMVACAKVRLMHASIRHMIKKYLDWDTETLGEPINQEDMAGTLQSFSSLILQGLYNMGMKLSAQEIDDYYYSWHVAGHFMGVVPELNPPDYETGLKLGHAIIEDQRDEKNHHESTDDLTQALVEYLNEILPGKIFDTYVPIFVIKYFLTKNTHSSIGFHLKPSLNYMLMELILKLVSAWATFQKWLHKTFIGRHFVDIKHYMMLKFLRHENKEKQVELYIPPSLKANWKETLAGKIEGVTFDD